MTLPVAALVAVFVAAEASPVIAPLSDADRAVFWGSPEDDPPPVLLGVDKEQEGRHYVTCDEWNLHLLVPWLKDLGGGYLGVGTDQAYLFMGWMRPTLAWLTDYDQVIVDLHRAYFAFFEKAQTPSELVEWFAPHARQDAIDLLTQRYATDPRQKAIVQAFALSHHRVYWRLKRLVAQLRKAKVPSFVTDQETYAFVKALVLAGRVRPLLGNLLADKGLAGAGAAAQKLGVPLRLVYVSNAEGYWDYPDSFKRNMAALPVDDTSLLLRTIAAKWTNGDYRYNFQTMNSFVAWLGEKRVRSHKQMVPFITLRSALDIPISKVTWGPGERIPNGGGRLNEPMDGPPVPENPGPKRPLEPPDATGAPQAAPTKAPAAP